MPLDPLILVTNDDGIASPGLAAAVRAVAGLGDVIVAAPERQWSGAGRSFAQDPGGRIVRQPLVVDQRPIVAYSIGASPAVAVLHALVELVPRRPSLVVSGINYGENIGADITHSGTVGAALQAAASGSRALAVSLQTPKETHTRPSHHVDFSTAVHFARLFTQRLLGTALPFDTDVLKVDIPPGATSATPWRVCRVSRHTYFEATPRGAPAVGALVGLDYGPVTNPECTEADSDIYALAVDRVVAVCPLTIDLTARVSLPELDRMLRTP
jgi:5'-nucleotidase